MVCVGPRQQNCSILCYSLAIFVDEKINEDFIPSTCNYLMLTVITNQIRDVIAPVVKTNGWQHVLLV